jgi:hypothetical protein
MPFIVERVSILKTRQAAQACLSFMFLTRKAHWQERG